MAKVSIVRCDSYEKSRVYSAVKESMEIAGFKIRKGSRVLIKPNILMPKKPELAITTHPSIVEAVCRILSERKCRIIVGESDGIGCTEKGFIESGIGKAAEKYGAKLVAFEKDDKKFVRNSRGKILKGIFFPKSVLDAEIIINLPKLKTHALTKFTGAVKNIYGTIPGATKSLYHMKAPAEREFCELLTDIYENVKPEFTIMDGITGMEGAGPSTGTPKKTGLIIAGKDGVAVDYVSSEIIGFNPNEILTTKIAFERKLSNEKEIRIFGREGEIIGENLKKYYVNYEKIINVNKNVLILAQRIFGRLSPKPVVLREKCIGCMICVKHCPVKAISFDRFPKINREKCISCFCCVELCPEKAMRLKTSIILRMMQRASGILNLFRRKKV
ncbi:MAG: DUF362 domain-containing protein [Candidatus Woesearchaeota archaeon]|nr:DUF362 domain-containing protein [Candidatus Woesearchaeota archaeon]